MTMKRAIAVGLVAMGLTACSSSEPEVETRNVRGIVTALGSTIGHGGHAAVGGEPCWFGEDKSDIVKGLGVQLRDKSGDLIALAELAEPKFSEGAQYESTKEIAPCALRFVFEDVAVEDEIYTVELEGRGSRSMHSSDMFPLVTLAIN